VNTGCPRPANEWSSVMVQEVWVSVKEIDDNDNIFDKFDASDSQYRRRHVITGYFSSFDNRFPLNNDSFVRVRLEMGPRYVE
jgi:hypothetical protein